MCIRDSVYPSKESFPNQYEAPNYHEWCRLECERIGSGTYIHVHHIEIINEEEQPEVVEVCHIRRVIDG